MNLAYYGKTDKGKLRKGNEDYFTCEKISPEEYLFIVADGMGGHQAGDVASKLGTQSFVSRYKKLRNKKTGVAGALKQSIDAANEAILKKASNDLRKRGMGTTFSAIAIVDMRAYLVHVGDSRVYLIRNNDILRLTTDHTFVEKMVEEGRLTYEEARDHPQKNILYMSLGARQSFFPEISESFEVKEGDVYILCSDGLNNMVPDHVIKDFAMNLEPKKSVESLVKLANDNGGTDNITIMVIQVEEQTRKVKTEPIKVLKVKEKKKGKLSSIFSKNKREEK